MFYYFLIFFIAALYYIICRRNYSPYNSNKVNRLVNKRNAIFSTIVTIILILIAGLRGITVGRDTDQYMIIFESVKDRSLIYLLMNADVEYGYVVFQYIVSKFGGDYQIFLMVSAILTVGPVGFIIYKYSRNPWISFIVFISFPVYTTLAFSALRQGIAFGFIMFAFHYSQKEKLLKYLLFITIAYFFHATAVVFLPIYWLKKIKFSDYSIIFFIILIVFGYILSSVLFSFFNSYSRLTYNESEAGGVNMYIFFLFTFIISVIYRKYAIDKYKSNAIYIYMIILSIIIWPLCSANPALFRLTFYFIFFLSLYVSNFIFSIKTKSIRKLFIGFFLIVCLYSIGDIVMRPVLINYPYYFYWESDKTKWDKLDNLW